MVVGGIPPSVPLPTVCDWKASVSSWFWVVTLIFAAYASRAFLQTRPAGSEVGGVARRGDGGKRRLVPSRRGKMEGAGAAAKPSGRSNGTLGRGVASCRRGEDALEPDPTPDLAAKKRAAAKIADIEAEWNGVQPLLDTGGLRVWHQPEGGAVHSFKYQVVLPVLPEPCVALAKEVDLMPKWHKFVPRARKLGVKPGVFGGILAYAELWLPWPLKNRGILCESAFFDCLEDDLGAYIVTVSSINESCSMIGGGESNAYLRTERREVEAYPRHDTSRDKAAAEDGSVGRDGDRGVGMGSYAGDIYVEEREEDGGESLHDNKFALGIPTTEAEAPRLHFESYTTFRPLPPLRAMRDHDRSDGGVGDDGSGQVSGCAPQTLWTFYFHKTDYQFDMPPVALGFLMKIMAPFVMSIAVNLAKGVPNEYRERMEVTDAKFYNVLKRRCQQHVRSCCGEISEGEGTDGDIDADSGDGGYAGSGGKVAGKWEAGRRIVRKRPDNFGSWSSRCVPPACASPSCACPNCVASSPSSSLAQEVGWPQGHTSPRASVNANAQFSTAG